MFFALPVVKFTLALLISVITGFSVIYHEDITDFLKNQWRKYLHSKPNQQ